MKTLTKAEEQVMQAVWKVKQGFIRDIIEALPAPKPHQNTVSTILKILVDKEFVGINVFGRQHQYYPLVSKDAYSKSSIKNLVKGYFGGSFSDAVSFMVKENSLSIEDLETLLNQLKKAKK
ncbi:BlaI/MecI/CopY family transcriptional regulator [Flavisolibacter nicotianae]|uniref:BlaI/MecI/CopY family transcriptional regulator n=1 Tax=Flavisolibacter nicotianae TaxID=2364882 RepID=UPI00196906CD|nr:BlaI/MecI/CopY family transcriptional regulator [Flavisolibacter nicotianae]